MSFFIMHEKFQNKFWKFYKKVPHQPIFLAPFVKNFGFSGLWCTTATICKLKNSLGGWAYDYTQFEKILNGIEQ